jgi:hypothetical protein
VNRYVYGRAWSHVTWDIGEIPEAEARVRFASDDEDDWFSVAAFTEGVSDDGIPEYVLEMMPKATDAKVRFFDLSRSLRFVYEFGRVGDALFLDTIREYTYPDDGVQRRQNEAGVVETLRYTPEGLVHQRKDDTSKPTVEEADYRDVDVSSHWEPIPEFGQWDSIARFDRQKLVSGA